VRQRGFKRQKWPSKSLMVTGNGETTTANLPFRKRLRSADTIATNTNHSPPDSSWRTVLFTCRTQSLECAAQPTELQERTTVRSDVSWRHFCLNARSLHIGSLAAGHLGVSDRQSTSCIIIFARCWGRQATHVAGLPLQLRVCVYREPFPRYYQLFPKP